MATEKGRSLSHSPALRKNTFTAFKATFDIFEIKLTNINYIFRKSQSQCIKIKKAYFVKIDLNRFRPANTTPRVISSVPTLHSSQAAALSNFFGLQKQRLQPVY